MFGIGTIIWGTLFSFAALIAGPWVAVQFDASFPAFSFGAFRYAGIPLIAVGGSLAFYCAYLLLVPSKKSRLPHTSKEDLIVSGPYLYVRNPFMLGIVLAIVGEAILLSRVVMFGYAAIFTWCVHFWIVFFEEPAMLERFGEDYARYKSGVPRWLPKFNRFGG